MLWGLTSTGAFRDDPLLLPSVLGALPGRLALPASDADVKDSGGGHAVVGVGVQPGLVLLGARERLSVGTLDPGQDVTLPEAAVVGRDLALTSLNLTVEVRESKAALHPLPLWRDRAEKSM